MKKMRSKSKSAPMIEPGTIEGYNIKVGDRVGAILNSIKDTIWVIGFGTYLGEQIVNLATDVRLMGLSMTGQLNHCIKLDSGKLVYGCECWWAGEADVHSMIGAYKNILYVDIDAERTKTIEQEINEYGFKF